MKKSTLSILTAVIAFSPLTALAQNVQTGIQTNSNSTAAIGDTNLVLQNTTQANQQQHLNLSQYGIRATPNAQTAIQGNVNEADAIGNHNIIGQDTIQTSTQGQVDVNQYLPLNFQQ